MFIHVIKPNECLWNIAKFYKISPQDIAEINSLSLFQKLIPGQNLLIPVAEMTHSIHPGETIYSIAYQYDTTINEIMKANQIKNPNLICTKEQLIIPSPIRKIKAIEVNGYVDVRHENSPQTMIQRIAPYLTYISIFNCGIKSDGSLEGLNDSKIIDIALKNKIAPLLVITNLKNNSFDPQLAHIILSEEILQNELIKNILCLLRYKKYYGVNLDFQSLYKEDMQSYKRFVKKVKNMLNEKGFIVSTSITPNPYNSYSSPHNIQLIENSNYSMYVTYPWGWSKGAPMPIVPFEQLKAMLELGLPIKLTKKLMIGIPLYGYDWTLPYIKTNTSSAKIISPKSAIKQAEKYYTIIHYNKTSHSPYYVYLDEMNKEHIVWFENLKSLNAKYQLVGQMGLKGINYWILSSSFIQNWTLLKKIFEIKKINCRPNL